ncbi:MAG TPA: hypothetical protein VF719_09460 [Abditibacteriaceae bacterium]|jgi:hypothetical protein
MTKLLLNIPDELAVRLEEYARRSGISVEEMALTQLRQMLQDAPSHAPSHVPEKISDAEFERVAKRAVERDIELLRRLAK